MWNLRKNPWVYSVATILLGALGLIFHWLQVTVLFTDESGLGIKNSLTSWAVVIVLTAIAVAVVILARMLPEDSTPDDPERSLVSPNGGCTLLLGVAGAIAGAGSLMMFFTETAVSLRVAGLMGLLAAPSLMFLPQLPRWGKLGIAVSLFPTVFFSAWLLLFYRLNAVNPVLWSFGITVLAIAACLYGSFRVSGYMFYRTLDRKAVTACGLGTAACMTAAMGVVSVALRMVFAGWAAGFAGISWLLVSNMGSGSFQEEP